MGIVVGQKLIHKMSNLEYEVLRIDHINDRFTVKRIDDGLELDFNLNKANTYFTCTEEPLPWGMQDFLNDTKLSPRCDKCECGVDSLGAGLHSDYCPKYGGKNV